MSWIGKRGVFATLITVFALTWASIAMVLPAADAATVTVAVAGDIAKDPDCYDPAPGDTYPCDTGSNPDSRSDYLRQRKTADQIAAFDPDYVIPAGDNQYAHGSGPDWMCGLTPKNDNSGQDVYAGSGCGS